LIVAATHGHVVHLGGTKNFDEYCLDERDFFFPEEDNIDMRKE